MSFEIFFSQCMSDFACFFWIQNFSYYTFTICIHIKLEEVHCISTLSLVNKKYLTRWPLLATHQNSHWLRGKNKTLWIVYKVIQLFNFVLFHFIQRIWGTNTQKYTLTLKIMYSVLDWRSFVKYSIRLTTIQLG